MNDLRQTPVDFEPTPDLGLLRKAVDWARTEAERPWDESEWYQEQFYIEGAEVGKSCETAFCIAGYVTSLDHTFRDMVRMGTVNVSDYAQAVLGLTEAEACDMFSGGNTLEDVERAAGAVAQRAGETL